MEFLDDDRGAFANPSLCLTPNKLNAAKERLPRKRIPSIDIAEFMQEVRHAFQENQVVAVGLKLLLSQSCPEKNNKDNSNN